MMIDPERVKFDLCPVYRVECEYVSVARAAAKLATRYSDLANRYDDALKRIHDVTAELEHLRREVNRG
jgi:hypothetical protein